MIVSFSNKGTEDIFNVFCSKNARKTIPSGLHSIAKRKLNMLAAATTIQDLKIPPNNKLEKLKGNLSKFHSIRINEQWRIIFKWESGNAHQVEICDYH